MKKIISILVAAVMLFSTFGVFADAAPEKMYIFVQAGAEDGIGSMDKPFASFEQARDKIREVKANGQYPEGGVVVYFRRGVYPIDKAIVLKGEQDSGTESGPIVYRSYMDEQVTFVGGAEISVSEFKTVSEPDAVKRLNSDAADKILVANLKDFGITDFGELNVYGGGSSYFTQPLTRMEENGVDIPTQQPPEVFFGDAVGTLARYPNDDFTLTGKIIQKGDEVQMWSDTFKTYDTFVPYEERTYPPEPSIFEVTPDVKERMGKWQYEDDIWVYGFFSENWSDTSLPVRETDAENGVITTELPSPKPIKMERRYYIYNVLPELDTPGEYYLDRNTGNLYIYPTDKDGKITFSSLNDNFLTISDVDNVTFKALEFNGTRSTAIAMYGCSDIHFEYCTITKAAMKALTAYNLMNCSLKGCYIAQTGTGGVYISINKDMERGEIAVDVKENLTPQNIVIEDCEFEEFGRINATYSPAISLGGAGNYIRHCKIHGGDHMALSPGANDLVIEYNEFYDLLRTADDSGAIYDGFCKESRGQVIRNNYFHDIESESATGTAVSMIYADDTRDDFTVEQNIFENIGGRNMIFYSNGGRNHTIRNNIVLGADRFVHFNNHTSNSGGKYGIGQYNFVQYLDNPAYAKYPNFTELSEKEEDYLPAKYNIVNNNVLIGVNQYNSTTAELPPESVISPSLMLDEGTDIGFADMENRNYTLSNDSVVYETFPDFKAPEFEKMGTYTDMLEKKLSRKTTVLLEGSPITYEGVKLSCIGSEYNVVPVIKESVVYLPVRYLAQRAGVSVKYNDESGEITLGSGEKAVVIAPDEYFTVSGRALASQDIITKVLGVEAKALENGVIIVGNNLNTDGIWTELADELARRLYNE